MNLKSKLLEVEVEVEVTLTRPPPPPTASTAHPQPWNLHLNSKLKFHLKLKLCGLRVVILLVAAGGGRGVVDAVLLGVGGTQHEAQLDALFDQVGRQRLFHGTAAASGGRGQVRVPYNPF